MNKNLGIIGIVGLVVIVGFTIFMMSINYQNQHVTYKQQIKAQKGVCETYFDKMWKVINQKAQVSNEYKEAFKDIYPALIEGRYSNGGGQLFQFIKEHNPQFDISLYKDLMQSIEKERGRFFEEQKSLIDIDRDHKTFLNRKPAKWFLNENDTVPITLITSQITKDVYLTGEENDVSLFSK